MATIEPRRNADGATTYRVRVRLKGHPVQHASFERRTDARRWAQSTEAAIREGRHFKSTESRKHTLADAIKKYRDEVMPHKPGCSRSQPCQLDWWEAQAGAYTLANVTPSLIAECREKLLNSPRNPRRAKFKQTASSRNRSPATVNRYLAVLSHIFSIAVKEWEWIDDNPVRKVRKPKEARGRDRFLSDAERQRFLATCEASGSLYLHTIVVLALSTGMRKGEILNLRWKQVDFKNKRIILTKTKNGETRSVPLVGYGHTLLQAHAPEQSAPEKMLFPGKTDGVAVDIKKGWTNALKAAEITDFRFHDLRHSAASYLGMNGATLLEIAAVLGHKTLSMVKRYSHLSDTHTHGVVSSMNDKIFGSSAS
jgi:integrase